MKISKKQAMEIIKTHQVCDIQVDYYTTVVFCTPDEEDIMNDVNTIKFIFYHNDSPDSSHIRLEVQYFV